MGEINNSRQKRGVMKKLTDFEQIVLGNLSEAVNRAVQERLGGYQSPLLKLIDDAFKIHDNKLRELVYEALGQSLDRQDFKQAIKQAFDHKVARTMVDHLSGSIDKAINAIKSDPTIKAKMVLAIEAIIKEKHESI